MYEWVLPIVINSEDPTTENFEKDYVTKWKGLRVTSENARLINMEVMKSLALGPEYAKHAKVKVDVHLLWNTEQLKVAKLTNWLPFILRIHDFSG